MIPGVSPALERILEAGNKAPSGENCQPWRFIVSGQKVEVRLLPERDQSAYSWGQRASYLACGAAIENMVLAASCEGVRMQVYLLPQADDPLLVARLELTPDPGTRPEPLAKAVDLRITNREPFLSEPLTPPQREAFFEAVGKDVEVALTEDRSEIRTLARVGSTNEEIMLRNRSLHQFFFSHVNWTKEEDEARKTGFYIKTLGLPPPARILFRAFRHWEVMRVLCLLRFNAFIAMQNANTNAAASALGAIVVNNTTPLAFVAAGRSVERLWLAATAQGLSLQPLTGVLFFMLAIRAGEDKFSPDERAKIMRAYETAERIFKTRGRTIAFMFRVGRGERPSAQAIRFPLRDVVTTAA